MPECPSGSTADFDAFQYWHERLKDGSSLEATGTRPFGEAYQRYLYRLKEGAILRVLRPWRDRLRGARVLNVGCGWGHFEPFFGRLGAAEVVGVDFVESAVSALQAARPEYAYHVGNIAEALPPALEGRAFDVVTAIDVLYHITDDAAFHAAVRRLCTLCEPQGGLLLWTDAPFRRNDQSQQHCRYRPRHAYQRVFSRSGVRWQSSTPMYHLFDVYRPWSEWAADHPRFVYPLMYGFDRLFARFGGRQDANCCCIAQRNMGSGGGSQ